MSINVTVTGNPVSIRRGKTVLSDLDQLKKSERDRRRKLRLEQVRQQSKEISNRLLERARNVTKSQLTQLEKDGRSELKQMHDRKLMDLQRKYQEDMEDIGQAHVSASLQPNVDVILEADVGKNRLIAAERGKEALQRVKEGNQIKDIQSKQHERQRQVREMENARAAMIANLPTRQTSQNKSEADSDLTGGEEIIHKSPKKKRGRKIGRPQKNTRKVIVESPNLQVIVRNQKPRRSATSSATGATWRQGEVPEVLTESNKTVTDISEFPVVMTGLESDGEEPRKSLPTLSSRSKADKVARYNPQDYKPDSSTSTTSSSSSSRSTVSDDSSYFSDGAVDQFKSQRTPRNTTSVASSKVQLYDHNTRQQNLYQKPLGVVQKIDINGEPNAEEQARAMLQSDRVDDQLAERRRRHAQRRGNDALLRDRVRRDYQKLQQNLEHLSREERKLTASQIHGPRINDIHLDPTRRQELLTKRQRDMSEAFETNFQNVHSEPSTIDQRPFERPVTISPYDKIDHIPRATNAVWQETPFFESAEQMAEKENQNENELSRNEQIFEMLRKVERQKRLLLREFGAELPDNIFSVSMKPLFSEEASGPKLIPKNQLPPSPKAKEPIVNISDNDETTNTNTDREKKKTCSPSERIEIAVQTSTLDEIGAAMDKSVQVEFTSTLESSDNRSSEEVIEKANSDSELLENIDRPNSGTGSSDSIEAGIIIDLSKKQVKVTPRKRKTSIKGSKRNSPRVVVKPRSMPTGMPNSLGKKLSRSMPVSQHSTPRSNVSSSQPVKITDKKVKIHLDDSRIKVQINPSSNKNVSKNVSTETSATDSLEASRENKPYFKQKLRSELLFSDTSTSYASPPPVVSGASRNGLMDTIPVLEILENSENESVKLRRKGLSPVSSPGTPSPRIINLPTNIVYSRYANKVLEFTDPTMSRSLQNAITILLPQQHSTPNDATGSIKSQQQTVVDLSDQTPDNCSCINPQCKLMHSNINNVQNSASNNYPEVLKRYQDLKIICAERIASLTDLIEKVRSDQRDMDLSINEQSNESTTLRIPLPTSARNSMQTVRKLVDSIEAIHHQLAQTLNESQRIIATEDREEKSKSSKNTSDTNNKSALVDENSVSSDVADAPGHRVTNQHRAAPGVSGPKIIRTEIVKIPLSHLRQLTKTQLMEESRTPEVAKSTSPHQGEDLVKQLSKEILEQSKALDNPTMSEISQNSRDFTNRLSPPMQNIPISSPNRAKSPSLSKSLDEQLHHVSPIFNDQRDMPYENVASWNNAEDSSSKTETDFIPLLAGIPKIQRTQENGSDRSRPRPPVTLTYGPHRIHTESTGHELSTIVEFDTPDMVNKSHGSAKSPKGKSKKSLSEGYQNTGEKIIEPLGTMPRKKSPAQAPKTTSSSKTSTPNQDKKEQITQYTATPKPAKDSDECVDTCPRLANRSSVNSSDSSESHTDKAGSQRDDSNLSKDSLINISLELRKRNLIFHSQIDPETLSGPFYYDEHKKSVISPRTEPDKDKITSTSSNSFSGLSGISEIATTPTSDVLKYTSSPEEMEVALRKMGLGWAATTLKKTREASALSSSSNSDAVSITAARKIPSPLKKDLNLKANYLPELSDVSSISMKYANKSTERALLLKARTSTPNIENSNSSCEKSTSTTINSSAGISHIPSDVIFIAPNLSLSSKKNMTNDRTKLDHDFDNPTDAT